MRNSLLVWPLLLLGACSMGDARRDVVVRDSAGVELVESGAPAWEADAGWRIAAEPELAIGQADGAPEEQFHVIADAVRLSDGGIAVADGGAGVVRYFDADGRFLRTVGGQGEGPGEFRMIRALRRLPGDSLLVLDGRLQRATVLDEAGELVDVVPLTRLGTASVYRLSDGRWLGVRYNIQEALQAGKPGLYRPPATVVAFRPEGASPDTVGVFPGSEAALVEMGEAVVPGAPPYGRTFTLTVHDGTLYLGGGDALRFEVYSPAGEHLRSVRGPAMDLTLTQEDLEAYEAAFLARAPDEGARAALQAYMEKVPHPEQKAAYSRILVDAGGNVWLGAYGSPPYLHTGVWRVFDAEGRYLGRVTVPERLRILRVGDTYVLGRWRDEMDVESVRLYRLEKG